MELKSGNILIRPMLALQDKGAVVDGHTHNFDHTTYCVRGSFLIEKLDDEGNVVKSMTVTAGNWVLIVAGVKHRLTSLEAGTIGHCIYSHRDPQTTDVVQEWNGWEKAYV